MSLQFQYKVKLMSSAKGPQSNKKSPTVIINETKGESLEGAKEGIVS